MKRIFIALRIDPNEAFKNSLSKVRNIMNRGIIKWTDIRNLHVTLAFLGNIDEYVIEEVRHMLHERCKGSGDFELCISGYGVSRSVDDHRILWAGIKQSKKLDNLNGIIINGLKDVKIKMEERPFKPHVTIGRVNKLTNAELFSSVIEQFQDTEFQIVPINELILYQSILYQRGPEYIPIDIISL